MKKLFLAITLLAIAISANAQFKPSKGFTAEVNFRPLNANPIQVDYLKCRMFLDSKMAIRLGFEFNSYSNTTKADFSGITEETKSSYFVFGLRPGIEFHMKGTDRLSPYYGAELIFSAKSSSLEVTNDGGVSGKASKIEGAWDNTGTQAAYTMIGLNLVFGADYFISKNLYMGAELGFGFVSTGYKDITSSTGSTSATIPGASESNLGVNFNSAIRLGWAF